GRAENFLRL
uniref:Extended FMRFamide-6 n=1 Tax=Namaquaphasma ookiepense TaxID=409167 RepID=FAR6_NAMOO|nr:RecName: Full=Extended FMRFamide-6; Short=FMRFa-6 [Namaquaphasma ookiepense]